MSEPVELVAMMTGERVHLRSLDASRTLCGRDEAFPVLEERLPLRFDGMALCVLCEEQRGELGA